MLVLLTVIPQTPMELVIQVFVLEFLLDLAIVEFPSQLQLVTVTLQKVTV